MFKNVAGQFVIVYARDKSTGAEKTGDAANITARISKDSVDSAASNDVNPTEISNTTHKGQYAFLISQGESNCDLHGLTAVSSTTDIELLPVFIYTRTPMRGTDGVDTATMVGTDNAALASVCTEDRLAALTDWINGGRLDLLLDAIKVATDKLTFTVANQLDSNIQYVNDVQVNGTGAEGDEWGPA